jgi:hypothetical protein
MPNDPFAVFEAIQRNEKIEKAVEESNKPVAAKVASGSNLTLGARV